MASTELVRASALLSSSIRLALTGPVLSGILLSVVLLSGTARAQTRFSVPDGCGSELEFRAELERLLEDRARALLPTSLLIGAPDASGEHTLRLDLAGRTRVLRDRDCATLLRTAVVIVAAAARELPPPPPPPEQPEPEPEPPPDFVPVPDEPRQTAPATALTWGVHAGAGVASGVVPGLGLTLLAGASLETAAFGASLSLRYALPQEEQSQGRAVDVDSIGLRADVLYRFVPVLELALGVEADWLHGTGAPGVSARQSSSAWRIAPTLGLSAIPWPEAQPRLELGVSAQLALIRPRFVVEGFGDLYRVPLVGVDAIIRGAWLFR
jgi:hypothetical protein